MAKKLNFVVFEDVGGRFTSEFVSINRQEADKLRWFPKVEIDRKKLLEQTK